MYEKAIKLLPGNHADVPYLRSNMAACYMQMGSSEYPKAVYECNLALEVNPKYTKALLKRARCYEALNRLDLALRDARRVLQMEKNNFMAAEIAERVKATIDQNGGAAHIPLDLIPVPEYIEPHIVSSSFKASKDKVGKKKRHKKAEEEDDDEIEDERQKHAKLGTPSETGPHLSRAAKKREKKAKKKRVAQGMTDQDNQFEEVGYTKQEMKTQKKRVSSDSDSSDEEESDESTTAVEYNRFEILNDVKLDANENEEKKAKKKKKVPNGVCEKNKKEEKKAKNKNVSNGVQGKATHKPEGRKAKNKVEESSEDRKAEDKLVVGEIMTNDTEAESRRTVKLIFGDDIRFAQVPINCSVLKLREIVCNRFPNCKAILIKYKDQEGDLVTITTTEEFRWAESSVGHGFIRLHIVDVNPDQDPLLEKIKQEKEEYERILKQTKIIEIENAGRRELQNGPSCIDDWIIHFAYLFKHYVGFESDCYLDLHDVGVKLYSEAMEETVTSEEAQDIFSTSEEKFQELAALALFNWGNVHMSRARRRVFTEYHTGESEVSQVTDAYSLAQKEYSIAGKRFEEALKIKPNFYEGIIALGQLQFEQAKLSWHYAINTDTDLESWPSSEVLQLYNNASKNMERGIKMWEEALVQHLIEVANQSESHNLLQQMKLGNLFKEISAEETAEQAANIRSQVNLLWGTMLYERSVVEFKLGLPNWQNCLGAATDKFEYAGASPEDIAVMVKNHCSNSIEGELP